MSGTELVTLHTSLPEYSQPPYVSGIRIYFFFFFKLRKLKLGDVRKCAQVCIKSTQFCVAPKPALFPSSHTFIT